MVKNSLKTVAETAPLPDGYKDILTSIISKIKAAQAKALKAVNYELIEVYRGIGQTIHDKQEKGEWGDSVVERLAQDLQKGFPGMRGFSPRNLWRMKDLYRSCRGSEKLTTLSSEISWSHNVALLSKCEDPLEKEFYMRMSKRNGWTYRVLIHHIENGTYEKTISAQSNFEKSLPTNLHAEAKLAVRDDYALDFLEIGDEHTERELERAIVRNIEYFLREVGDAYSFIGSQYRLEIEGREFFIENKWFLKSKMEYFDKDSSVEFGLWKEEGYAEYVAGGSSIPLGEGLKMLNNEALIGYAPHFEYFKYWLAVRHLILEKHMTFEEILYAKLNLDDVLREAKHKPAML